MAILDVPFIDMLVWAQADKRAGDQLAVALDGIDDDLRRVTFARIERHRQHVGTTAATAYGPTLRKGRAPGLRAAMLEALIADCTRDGIDLVRELRDGERDVTARRALQASLLRMNTHAIEPTAPRFASSGQGYLSSCDQHGDFVVIGCYENPDDTRTVVDICIRAGGEIRGGFVLLRQSRSDVSQLLGELGAGAGGFAPISLSEVTAMVEDSLERTRCMRRPVSPDLQPALALVSQTTASAAQRSIITPAWDAPLDRVHALLASPGHDRAWLLPAADVEIVLSSPPPRNGASREWINRAARALGKRTRSRARLVEMAKHMACWHRAKGELDAAALCVTLGHLTEKQAATSPLLIAILERAFGREAISSEQASTEPLCDHAIRNVLRSRAFADIETPKGKDVAMLDFTEAAYASLRQSVDASPTESSLLNGVPGGRRARSRSAASAERLDDSERIALARDLAEAFVQESVGRKKPADMNRIARRMRAAVVRCCHADEAQAEAVAVLVLAAFASFLRDVCSRCPVRCIEKARVNHREAFFSPDHPAF
jgi:hypothetical protein